MQLSMFSSEEHLARICPLQENAPDSLASEVASSATLWGSLISTSRDISCGRMCLARSPRMKAMTFAQYSTHSRKSVMFVTRIFATPNTSGSLRDAGGFLSYA